jgi:hypothetical protein
MLWHLQVDVYSPFKGVLEHLWTLWELVVLAQPFMILGPSPGTAPLVHQAVKMFSPTKNTAHTCMIDQHDAC